MTISRIHGANPENDTIGLHLSADEGVNLAVSLIFASQAGKAVDLKVVKKPRKNGRHAVTVTTA